MKKIIILLAGIVLAISANAATTDWKFYNNSGTFKDGYVKLSGGTAAALSTKVYCILVDDLTQSALVTGLRNGTYTQDSIASLAKAFATTSASGALVKDDGTQFQMDATLGKEYSFYEVAFASTDDGDFVYVSALAKSVALEAGKEATIGIAAGTSANAKDINTSFGSGAWYQYSESIPEPTSAMMIMLGLAGLALRRKQK